MTGKYGWDPAGGHEGNHPDKGVPADEVDPIEDDSFDAQAEFDDFTGWPRSDSLDHLRDIFGGGI